MIKKYIFLPIFLVLFATSACKKNQNGKQSFEDFTSSVDEVKSVIITDDTPDTKNNQPIDKNTEKQAPTPANEPKKISEVKSTDIAEKQKENLITEKISTKTETKKYLNDFSTKYNLGYLSFNVADFYCELKNTGKNEYTAKFYSKANGFVDYLFGWMSYSVSKIKISGDEIIPQSFKTKVMLKKKLREIDLRYDSAGKINFENVIPPDNRDKRPAVEASLKLNTYDPLSLGLEARRLIIEAFEKDNFSSKGIHQFNLPLYDGRRRSNIMFTLYKKKFDNNYRLSIQQKKIAGFTDNELKDENRSDKTIIDIYIEPNSFVPIEISGKSPVGTAKAKFKGYCPESLDNCITKK